jgi:outer membrane protein OmpA-like peptidoglycan-associated protein
MRVGVFGAIFLCCTAAAVAQTSPTGAMPSTDQMIEQLKSPRTRSLRNLQIEAVSPNADAASAPSSSGNVAAAAASEPKPQLSLLIQFDFDSARIRPESLVPLSNLATALKSDDLKASKFAVEGHTDGKGRPDYNQRLSQSRALAVSSYLASQGVSAERLLPSGKGSAELANKADPGAAENRRVRIVNLD